jgi:hypothetical protein
LDLVRWKEFRNVVRCRILLEACRAGGTGRAEGVALTKVDLVCSNIEWLSKWVSSKNDQFVLEKFANW